MDHAQDAVIRPNAKFLIRFNFINLIFLFMAERADEVVRSRVKRRNQTGEKAADAGLAAPKRKSLPPANHGRRHDVKFRLKPAAHRVANTNGLAPSFSLRRSQHASFEACRDEHFPAGILTPGFKPRSGLPA